MPQPNFLFILIDDLGWRDLSCYGSTFYETPNLDRLAGQGVRFTRAYASAPVCSPTRASILTGKTPARVGVTQYIGGHAVARLCDVPYFACLPLSEVSLAACLRGHGYQTWHIGKWHLGEQGTWPEAHGFDVNLGGCGWGYPHGGYFSPYGLPNLPDGPRGEYLTDRLSDEAIALIRTRGDKPFLLNLWHYAVHVPIQPPPGLSEKYRYKTRDMGLDKLRAIVPGEPIPAGYLRGRPVQRRVVQSDPDYAAMIENLDHNVGRVLAALDESGLADNTMVVFASDNGGLATAEGSPTCNLPLAEGKGWVYEGGTRISQIIRWPAGARAAATCDVPVTSTDFYPTFLEAAGLPLRPDQHCDGVSLMPLLEGGTTGPVKKWHGHSAHASQGRLAPALASPFPSSSSPALTRKEEETMHGRDAHATHGRDGHATRNDLPQRHAEPPSGPPDLPPRDLFWHYPHYSNQGGTPACSMVSGYWKLIEFFEDGRVELFDLHADPQERHNLAAARPEIVAELHPRMLKWRKEVEALIPKPNPNDRPPPSFTPGVDDPTV
jgi:arylsulfatase A-like enzyme